MLSKLAAARSHQPGTQPTATPGEQPYLLGDFIAGVQVVESGDTGWSLWNKAAPAAPVIVRDKGLAATVRQGFAATAPGNFPRTDRMGLPAVADTRPPPSSTQSQQQPAWTVERVLFLARLDGRVCPKPHAWRLLHAGLGGDAASAQRGLRAPPLEPEAFAAMSVVDKRVCLREQMHWAERHHRLQFAGAFLRGLAEEHWVHVGDGCYV
jgi:hypothetical protein